MYTIKRQEYYGPFGQRQDVRMEQMRQYLLHDPPAEDSVHNRRDQRHHNTDGVRSWCTTSLERHERGIAGERHTHAVPEYVASEDQCVADEFAGRSFECPNNDRKSSSFLDQPGECRYELQEDAGHLCQDGPLCSSPRVIPNTDCARRVVSQIGSNVLDELPKSTIYSALWRLLGWGIGLLLAATVFILPSRLVVFPRDEYVSLDIRSLWSELFYLVSVLLSRRPLVSPVAGSPYLPMQEIGLVLWSIYVGCCDYVLSYAQPITQPFIRALECGVEFRKIWSFACWIAQNGLFDIPIRVGFVVVWRVALPFIYTSSKVVDLVIYYHQRYYYELVIVYLVILGNLAFASILYKKLLQFRVWFHTVPQPLTYVNPPVDETRTKGLVVEVATGNAVVSSESRVQNHATVQLLLKLTDGTYSERGQGTIVKDRSQLYLVTTWHQIQMVSSGDELAISNGQQVFNLTRDNKVQRLVKPPYDVVLINLQIHVPSVLRIRPIAIGKAKHDGKCEMSYFLRGKWWKTTSRYVYHAPNVRKHYNHTENKVSGAGVYQVVNGATYLIGVHTSGHKEQQYNLFTILKNVFRPRVNFKHLAVDKENLINEDAKSGVVVETLDYIQDAHDSIDASYESSEIDRRTDDQLGFWIKDTYYPSNDWDDDIGYETVQVGNQLSTMSTIIEQRDMNAAGWNQNCRKFLQDIYSSIVDSEAPPEGKCLSKVGTIAYIAEQFSDKKIKPLSRECKQFMRSPIGKALKGLGHPRRGGEAEVTSMEYQASQIKLDGKLPDIPFEVVSKSLESFTKSYPEWVAPDFDDLEEIKRLILLRASQVNPHASPGIPLSSLSRTNADLLMDHANLTLSLVLDRLIAMTTIDYRSYPIEELVRRGLVDPVKVFVKQEPHKSEKIKEGRMRIISSVSIIMNIVERVVFHDLTKSQIDNWIECPSKPGMGFTDDMTRSFSDGLRNYLQTHGTLDQNDVKAWDWSVPWWLMEMVTTSDKRNCRNLNAKSQLFLNNWTWVLQNAIWCDSDGDCHVVNVKPGELEHRLGIMKSGDFRTSEFNSKMRVLLNHIVTHWSNLDTGLNSTPYACAMGDDCIENTIKNSATYYERLGFRITDSATRSGFPFEFCSHEYRSDGKASLMTWPKMIFSMLHKRFEPDLLTQLRYELRNNSELPEIIEQLTRCGWIPRNSVDEDIVQHCSSDVKTNRVLVLAKTKPYEMGKRKATNPKAKQTKRNTEPQKLRRDIAETRREIKRIVDRTITSNENAKTTAAVARRVNNTSVLSSGKLVTTPSEFLTQEQHTYHECMKCGIPCDPLINNNIEKTVKKQIYTSDHSEIFTIPDGNSITVAVMSCVDSQTVSSTPKSFNCGKLRNIGAVAAVGLPGPASNTSGEAASCVIYGELTGPNSPNTIITDTSQGLASTPGYMNPISPIVPLPWVSPNPGDGSKLRWQLVAIGVACINVTVGSSKGGMATIVQPINEFNDLTGAVQNIDKFQPRGIYRTYENMEVGRVRADGDVDYDWFAVRDGLCSYHYSDNSGSVPSLEAAALMLHLGNDSGASNKVKIFVQLHWSIAGQLVTGVAQTHIPSPLASEHAAYANNTMFAAGIPPGAQKGNVSIPAALSLMSDKALQAFHALKSGAGIALDNKNHPVVQHMIKLVGKHLPSLVKAGVVGAKAISMLE